MARYAPPPAGFLAQAVKRTEQIKQGHPLDTEMLGHYQQTKNMLVNYSQNALGFF